MSRRAFIFVGGGSGGHILPAVAIAEEIAERDPSAGVVYVCSDRPIDREVLGRIGAPFTSIPARPFGLKPASLARLVWNWGSCVRIGRERIRSVRDHHAEVTVLSTGGFVGPPMVRAALAERTRVVLVNLDAVPGRANRWIGRRAASAMTTYPIADQPGWEVVRPIVRRGARPPADAGSCRRLLGLDADRPTLAVLGGSQGAGSINDALIELAQRRDPALAPWQLVHQTGARALSRVARAYADAGVRAVVEPFFDPVGPVWGAADLVVARSGAGTVAEAIASGAPAVFLPYPHHHDDHQRRNADPMTVAHAAIVIPDRVDPGPNADALAATLADLAPGGPSLASMSAAARGLGPADGAGAIADRLLQ